MSIFTITSPTSGGLLPTGITEIGGVVLDLVGVNGVRVVAQLAASSLFQGFYDSGVPSSYNGNPGTIGVFPSLSSAAIGALGGGLAEAAIRITLYDGDTSAGNFDDGNNVLLLNGVNFGNFSSVTTQRTSSDGLTVFFTETGFQNNQLNTGWFNVNGSGNLSALFSSLSTGITMQVQDDDPYDNFYDFTQGIDGGLIDVGTPPNVAPLAIDDGYSLTQGGSITVNALNGILSNDVDLEGAALTAGLVNGPSNGTLSLNADGSFTYTPNAGFTGTDVFSYRANDGALNSGLTFVTLTVKPTGGGGSGVPTPGDDVLKGTRGADRINGLDGNDYINAGDGDDIVIGGGGDDRVVGGGGNDRISGGQGRDNFSGGTGDDYIYGGGGDDQLNGGTGFDRAVYRGDISDYSFSIDSVGRLHIVDSVVGRDGHDTAINFEEYNFGGQIYSAAAVLDLA